MANIVHKVLNTDKEEDSVLSNNDRISAGTVTVCMMDIMHGESSRTDHEATDRTSSLGMSLLTILKVSKPSDLSRKHSVLQNLF